MLGKEEFTSAEISILFTIIPYIGYYDLSGLLITKKGITFVESLNSDNLRKKCSQMSDSSFKRGINRLVKKQILIKEKKGRDNVFYVNPFIFWKGSNIPTSLYAKFKKTKWNIYDKP